MRYLVELTIDQRPTRQEWVSEKVYNNLVRLGWAKDGRMKLVETRP